MKLYHKFIFAASLLLISSLLFIALFPSSDVDETQFFRAERGPFEILVTVTGELESENSVRISGPQALQSRNIRLRSVPIQDMIAEGTEVIEGDWIATLDRTEAELSLRDLYDQMLSEEAQYNAAILDTTIMLSNLRDELVNLEYALEERSLILEQSVYEPPATIRQAEINLERARIDLEQAKTNYELYEQQAVETIREASLNLDRRIRRYQALENLMDQFIITAPQSGMVIYHREWNGEKRRVGSTINSRDLTVAVIPELSSLVSRAYVNEIDIDKLKVGQMAKIGIDAYPERMYTGQVLEVSNVGMELPNTDAKVFEVLLRVGEIDNILRPAMTTSNTILTATYEDVVYVPMAALHDHQGVEYVYSVNGKRQVVITGPSNDNFVIIEKGLEEGDLVHTSQPENSHEFEFAGSELIAEGS